MVEHADEVREQERDRIVLDPFRLVGRAEAAHVGRDRPVPRGARARRPGDPTAHACRASRGRGSTASPLRRAGALVVDFDPRAVDVDAHDGSVYSVNSDMTLFGELADARFAVAGPAAHEVADADGAHRVGVAPHFVPRLGDGERPGPADRRRVATGLLGELVDPPRHDRVVLGRGEGVPDVCPLRGGRAGRAVGPLVPSQIGGCGRWTGRGRICASSSDTCAPAVRHAFAGHQARDDLERVRRAGRTGRRPPGTGCRRCGARARTKPRPRRGRGGRATRGRSSALARRRPTDAGT